MNVKLVSFQNHVFEGFWYGSYDNLKEEDMTIRVWYRRFYGANELVGEAKQELLEIANGKVDREFHVKTNLVKGQDGVYDVICDVLLFYFKTVL